MEMIMDERSKKAKSTSPADNLLKTSKKGDITLTDDELAGVSGGDAPPTEQISLSFGKIELKYK
jgi:hypothetical protein